MPTKDKINAETIGVINELCDIILINGDVLDKNKRNEYIENYINKSIKLVGDNYEVRHVVQKKVVKYIEDCPSFQLFQFATDSKFHYYRKEFKEYYYDYVYSQKKSISNLEYPDVFEHVFDFIQESIDSHTLFRNYSIKIMDDAVNRAKKEAESAAQNAANSANIAAQKAKRASVEAADEAVKAVLESDKITENISQKINEQMNYVTRNVSETSVTILGIFAGIVLTVVAGIIYSSSALENISTPNFSRLICVVSLIGFVCFNLIATMLKFIERFRDKSDMQNVHFSKTVNFVSIVLIVIMVITGTCEIGKEMIAHTQSKVEANTEINTQLESQTNTDLEPQTDTEVESENDTESQK